MLISGAFELIQRPITLTNTLPFCAAVGGMLGALWDYVRNPKAGFPTTPSLRGAMLGALFAICLIGFGSSLDALKAAVGPHGRVPNIVPPALVRIVGLVGLAVITFVVSTFPRTQFWPPVLVIETARPSREGLRAISRTALCGALGRSKSPSTQDGSYREPKRTR
jgi:hypothetical protein